MYKALYIVVVISVLILGIKVASGPFFKKQQISSHKVNDFCTNVDPEKLQLVNSICSLPEGSQFTKFIWVITDGLPKRFSQEIFDHYQNHSVAYGIEVPGLKWSHAIYTSFLTGQLATNYNNDIIRSEHILQSIVRTSKSVEDNQRIVPHYAGQAFPILTLIPEPLWDLYLPGGFAKADDLETLNGPGAGLYDWEDNTICKNFATEEEKEADIATPIPRAHPYLFAYDNPKANVDKILSDVKASGKSMIAYSAVLDAWQHNGYTKEMCGWPRLLPKVNRDLKLLKEFIDQNPEYLLILSSDHGENQREPDFILHGTGSDGNEGYLLFYNPNLFDNRPQSQHQSPPFKKMDVVDVAPTITSYLRMVDIPMMSLGVSQSYFGKYQKEAYKKTLQKNLFQLAQCSNERGVSIDMDHIWKLIMDDSEDYEEQVKRLETKAQHIKSIFYSHSIVDRGGVVFLCILGFAATLLLFKLNHIWASREISLKFLLIRLPVRFIVCLFIYWSVYINILFAAYWWKPIYRSGQMYLIASPVLALILLIASYRYGEDSIGFPVQKNMRWKVLRMEAINWALWGSYFLIQRNFENHAKIFCILLSVVAIGYAWRWIRVILEKEQVKPRTIHALWGTYIVSIFGIELYSLTKQNKDLIWETSAFHIVAFLVYAILLCMLLWGVVKLVISGEIVLGSVAMTMCLQLLLWLIFHADIFERLMIITFLIQAHEHVLPLMKFYWYSIGEANSPLHPQELRSSLGYQALIVYMINMMLFMYSSSREVLDLAVNADYGFTGPVRVDIYPLFSGFLMGCSKVGFFVYGIFQLWVVIQQVQQSISLPPIYHPQEEYRDPSNHFVITWIRSMRKRMSEFRWEEDLLGWILGLYTFVISIAFQLLEISFTLSYAEQECIVNLLLFGVLTAIYFCLKLLSMVRAMVNVPKCFDHSKLTMSL